MSSDSEKIFLGVLTSIKEDPVPEKNFFIVACKGKKGSITVTKSMSIWEELQWPEIGDDILIIGIKGRAKGDRALKARFATATDKDLYLANGEA